MLITVLAGVNGQAPTRVRPWTLNQLAAGVYRTAGSAPLSTCRNQHESPPGSGYSEWVFGAPIGFEVHVQSNRSPKEGRPR